jgi:hypothetical protein
MIYVCICQLNRDTYLNRTGTVSQGIGTISQRTGIVSQVNIESVTQREQGSYPILTSSP